MAKATIAGTDTVNAALETKCNANFTELYNMLTGAATSTLLTPTIASFANATHTHANAAGGGAFTAQAWTASSGSLGANWTEVATVKWWKDILGIVHLQGTLNWGTGAGTTAYTLPSGYRPDTALILPIGVNTVTGVTAAVDITTGGAIVHSVAGAYERVYLDGITFKAA